MTSTPQLRILVLTKRQYTNKDLIDDRFGRIRELPLQLARKGHSVNGLCLSYRRRKTGNFHDDNVRWESINAGFFVISSFTKFMLRAMKLASETDIVWACSDSIFGIMGFLIARKQKIPLVFDLYDNFESFLFAKIPILKQLYKFAVRKSNAVTCVSYPLAMLAKSYGRKGKVFVIENAVRKDLFKPMDKQACRRALGYTEDDLLIGTAGALTKNRGIVALFEAFKILQKKNDNLYLVLAGPRDIKFPLDAHIQDLGILPFEKIPKLLNALDVAVVCNQNNEFGKYCFPQKTREIMACSIPIVTANTGSMKDLFADRPEWLYEPGDRMSLAKALEFRLRNPKTDYENLPDWTDLAGTLEEIMLEVSCEAN